MLEQKTSLALKIGVSWLIVQSSEQIEYGVVAERRLIGRSIQWLAVELSWSTKMLYEHSRNGANYS